MIYAIGTLVAIGSGACVMTARAFSPLLRDMTRGAAAHKLIALTSLALLGYGATAVYALYNQIASPVLYLVLASCWATFWSDSLFFLIHHMWSRWLVAILILLTLAGYGLVTELDAAAGIAYGYGLLWMLRMVFLRMKGLEALGPGDQEFICVIALSIGLKGTWITLMVASWVGIAIALIHGARTGSMAIRIPLGACIAAVGAFMILVYHQ